ncbi:hypothetical protein [Butyrivibrio proteoclasticus]|uniref:hypothetical protein n=1 Tax=Butyrivibrio proteoclasticus TaxID=43305 RepID=UPI000B074BA8|nr:hypothetical protein [Butyrivibrio proteoclasticus]
MIIMIALFYSRASKNKIYIAVIHYEGVETGIVKNAADLSWSAVFFIQAHSRDM